MSEYNIVARVVGKFDGINVTAKGTVDLKFKLPYDELPNYIVILQMLNNNITVETQILPAEPLCLGDYIVKSLNIAGDGEAKLSLMTTTDTAEMDHVNTLSSDIGSNVVITMMADVEIEEDEEQEWDESEAIESTGEFMDNESWGDDDENDNDGWE